MTSATVEKMASSTALRRGCAEFAVT